MTVSTVRNISPVATRGSAVLNRHRNNSLLILKSKKEVKQWFRT
jgi:hypothetical protein